MNSLSFKQWLINEGKALDVSPDMVDFAKEIVEKLKNRNFKFAGSGPINDRVVNSKYGTKRVSAGLYSSANEKNTLGHAYPKSSQIVIIVPTINNIVWSDDKNGLPNQHGELTIDWDKLDLDQIYDTVIHELVHVFDPKQNLTEPKWIQRYSIKDPDQSPEQEKNYWLHPKEQDSYIAEYSRRLVRYLIKKNNGDKNKAIQELSSIKPWDYIEELWYKNPKMWKKYLNTAYSVLSTV